MRGEKRLGRSYECNEMKESRSTKMREERAGMVFMNTAAGKMAAAITQGAVREIYWNNTGSADTGKSYVVQVIDIKKIGTNNGGPTSTQLFLVDKAAY
eukprot:448394-Hanusia_phi.AAC.1